MGERRPCTLAPSAYRVERAETAQTASANVKPVRNRKRDAGLGPRLQPSTSVAEPSVRATLALTLGGAVATCLCVCTHESLTLGAFHRNSGDR